VSARIRLWNVGREVDVDAEPGASEAVTGRAKLVGSASNAGRGREHGDRLVGRSIPQIRNLDRMQHANERLGGVLNLKLEDRIKQILEVEVHAGRTDSGREARSQSRYVDVQLVSHCPTDLTETSPVGGRDVRHFEDRSEEHTSELQSRENLV